MRITQGHDLRERPPAPVYDLAAARRRRDGGDEPTDPAPALEVAS